MRRAGIVFSLLILGGHSGSTQVPIPSRAFRAVEFTHENRRYVVDRDTGAVVAWDQPPAPPPLPALKPKPARLLFFVSATKEREHRSWLRVPEVADNALRKSIRIYTMRSLDDAVDLLGYRPLVRKHAVPCFVIFDEQGRILLEQACEGPADLSRAMESFN